LIYINNAYGILEVACNSFKFAAATLWNSLKYISKSYMQIKRAKTVAEYVSSACRTATFSTIPGLH
jgi:hypothetical protein